MNKELLDKLLECIDARIAEKSDAVRDSSDEGLSETIHRSEVERELRALVS